MVISNTSIENRYIKKMRKFQGRHPSSDKILEVLAPNLVVAKKMNPYFTDWEEVKNVNI